MGSCDGEDKVAIRNYRVLEGDLSEISVIERRKHQPAVPPTLSERIRVMGQNALDEYKASHGDLSEEPRSNA